MDFPFSEDFKAEVKKYNLQFKCVHCIHFNQPKEKCSFEYPVEQHYYFYIMDYGEKRSPRFSFCKHFEAS